MKHLGLAAGLAALLSSGAAMGADVYSGSTKDAPGTFAAATTNWSGLWLGAVGGIAIGSNKLDYNYSDTYTHSDPTKTPETYNGGIELDGLSDKGLFGELQLGYNYQLGSAVVGLFGGLNMGNGEFKVEGHDDHFEADAELTFSQKWGAVVGPRVGFARGKTLLYLAGGAAFGEMEKVHGALSFGSLSGSGDVFPKQETDLFGWFGEVGMEHKFNEHVAFKLAGRYTDYGAIDLYKDSYVDGRGSGHEKLELDRDVLSVMGGLTFYPNAVLPSLD